MVSQTVKWFCSPPKRKKKKGLWPFFTDLIDCIGLAAEYAVSIIVKIISVL